MKQSTNLDSSRCCRDKKETLSHLPQFKEHDWKGDHTSVHKRFQSTPCRLSFQVQATEPKFVSRSPFIHANTTERSVHFLFQIDNRTQLKHADPRSRFVPIPLIIPQGESIPRFAYCHPFFRS